MGSRIRTINTPEARRHHTTTGCVRSVVPDHPCQPAGDDLEAPCPAGLPLWYDPRAGTIHHHDSDLTERINP